MSVAAGSVTLTATPEDSSFQLGDWYGVDGDKTTANAGDVTGSGATAVSTVHDHRQPGTIRVRSQSAARSQGGSGSPGRWTLPVGALRAAAAPP